MPKAVSEGAARAPIGSFQSALAAMSAPELFAVCIQKARCRADLPLEELKMFIANVLSVGVGQARARQAALFSGMVEHAPALTLHRVCDSGLQAVVSAAQTVHTDEREIVEAGGMS